MSFSIRSIFWMGILGVSLFCLPFLHARENSHETALESLLKNDKILLLSVKPLPSGYSLVEYTEDLEGLSATPTVKALLSPNGNLSTLKGNSEKNDAEFSDSSLEMMAGMLEAISLKLNPSEKETSSFEMIESECASSEVSPGVIKVCCVMLGVKTFPDGSYCVALGAMCTENGNLVLCAVVVQCFDENGEAQGNKQAFNCISGEPVPMPMPEVPPTLIPIPKPEIVPVQETA